MATQFVDTFSLADGGTFTTGWSKFTNGNGNVNIVGSVNVHTTPTTGTYVTGGYVITDAAYASSEVLIDFRWITNVAEQYSNIYQRSDSNMNAAGTGSANAYVLQINPADNSTGFRIYRSSNGSDGGTVGTAVGWSAVGFTPTVGVWYTIRFQTVGSTIRARMWPRAGTEPTAWATSATNTSITSTGRVALQHFNGGTAGARTVQYDNLLITDDGVPNLSAWTIPTGAPASGQSASNGLSFSTPTVSGGNTSVTVTVGSSRGNGGTLYASLTSPSGTTGTEVQLGAANSSAVLTVVGTALNGLKANASYATPATTGGPTSTYYTSAAAGPNTVASTTYSAATSLGVGSKSVTTANGVTWAYWSDPNVVRGAYSTDGGVNWSAPVAYFSFPSTATITFAVCIASDDTIHFHLHIAGQNYNSGYTRMLTPDDSSRLSYTYSAGRDNVFTTSSGWINPDIVAFPIGAGWAQHLVIALGGRVVYNRVDIASSGYGSTQMYASGDTQYLSGNAVGSGNAVPTIDFRHTGDGRTIANVSGSPKPDIYVAWSLNGNGSSGGLQATTLLYNSATSWSQTYQRVVDGQRYLVQNTTNWVRGFWDGTRFVIAGTVQQTDAYFDVVVYDFDFSNDTPTQRYLSDGSSSNSNAAALFESGSAVPDASGNVYFFGTDEVAAPGSRALSWAKWNRSTSTMGARTVIDSTAPQAPYISPSRAVYSGAITYVYTDQTASPYYVRGGSVPVAVAATGTVSLSGSGTQTLSGAPRFASTLALSGSGTLANTGAPAPAQTLPLTGSGTLQTYGLPLTETFSGTGFTDPRWSIANVNGTFTFGNGVGTFNQSSTDYVDTSYVVFNIGRQDYFLKFDVDMRTGYDSFLVLYLRQPNGANTTGAYEHRMFLSSDGSPGTGSMDVYDGSGGYLGYQTSSPGAAGPQYTIEVEVLGARVRFWASTVGFSRQILYYDSQSTGGPYSTATANWFSLKAVSGTTDSSKIPIDNFGVYTESPNQASSGALALSGSGNLSATGAPNVAGTTSATGSGTLSNSGASSLAQTLALSGSGTQTASGSPRLLATSSPSGSGTLSTTAQANAAGSTTATGSGSLATTTATVSFKQTVAFSGSGTLSSTATSLTQSGAASPSGSGTLTSAGSPNATGSRIYTGTGTLDLSGASQVNGQLATSGSGDLAASGSSSASGAASLSGSGALTSTATVSLAGTTALSGSGTLSANGSATATQTLLLSGSGALSGSGSPQTAGSVDLSGYGEQTSTATVTARGSLVTSGDSELLVGSRVFAGTVLFAGTGQQALAGSPTLNTTSAARVALASSYAGSTTRSYSATASLSVSASATDSKVATHDDSRVVAVTATSTQTRDLTTAATATVDLDANATTRTLRVSSTDYAYVGLTASYNVARGDEEHVTYGVAYLGLRANAAVRKLAYTSSVARLSVRTSYTGVHRAVFAQRAFMGLRATQDVTTQRARYETATVSVAGTGVSSGVRVSAGTLRLRTSADAFWYFSHVTQSTARVSITASATHGLAPVYREIDLTVGEARTGYTVNAPRTDVSFSFGGVSNERRGRIRQR